MAFTVPFVKGTGKFLITALQNISSVKASNCIPCCRLSSFRMKNLVEAGIFPLFRNKISLAFSINDSCLAVLSSHWIALSLAIIWSLSLVSTPSFLSSLKIPNSRERCKVALGSPSVITRLSSYSSKARRNRLTASGSRLSNFG